MEGEDIQNVASIIDLASEIFQYLPNPGADVPVASQEFALPTIV